MGCFYLFGVLLFEVLIGYGRLIYIRRVLCVVMLTLRAVCAWRVVGMCALGGLSLVALVCGCGLVIVCFVLLLMVCYGAFGVLFVGCFLMLYLWFSLRSVFVGELFGFDDAVRCGWGC